MEIKHFSYRKTNYHLILGGDGKIVAFDAGWPGTYFEYAKAMKDTGFGIEQVDFAVVSHFHLDHAGLIGEMIKDGITCVVFDNQADKIDEMEGIILKKQKDYVRIDKSKLLRMKCDESRQWLSSLGIQGEVVQTPGHSTDSVSFVSDDGDALIGDLYREEIALDPESRLSLRLLRNKKVKNIYPAHGENYLVQYE